MCGTHMLLVVIIRQRAASTEAEAEHLHNNKPCSPIYCCSVVEAIPLDWNFCQPHWEWAKRYYNSNFSISTSPNKKKRHFWVMQLFANHLDSSNCFISRAKRSYLELLFLMISVDQQPAFVLKMKSFEKYNMIRQTIHFNLARIEVCIFCRQMAEMQTNKKQYLWISESQPSNGHLLN